ncbi:hypothetical protein SUGI_1024150 [Cryptomeria japonica]|uniref:putative receptor-like protein kinase At3g47110 n=1 Tax=Cryptomeria japonica TaxID=3369 RepID=UPI002414BBBA|nr:putative receptor-like protein kinase At3g47110 [Cryptomeria japonica]GLJ48546.1 hypothetical protein SUGI_1024150 [Cryptomeria japonica]
MATLILFFMLSCSSGIVLSRPIQLSNVSDEQALLAFRAGITVDLYNSLSDWNSTHPVCNWSGVKCSTRRQRVVDLNLTGMSLQGSISPFLANISFLRVLDLNNNTLSGPIPPELGNLARLRNLRLSKNRLEGSVPSTFSNCRLLKTFSVFRNRLSGGIPSEIGLLTGLQMVWLTDNKLTGPIPSSLGNCSSLSVLSLGYNRLRGTIPPELGMLSQLNTLRLHQNHLTGQIPPSLSNCTPLQNLEIHNNSLSGHIPWEFGAKLSQLQKLFLWGNRLTGRIPNSLSNCTQLKVIDLSVNQLNGTVPMEFSQLGNLERLFLGANRLVSGSSNSLLILSALSNCSLLELVHLGENELTGALPPSIDLLSSKLSIFNLSYNYLDGQIPPQIANLSNLTFLNLEGNFFNASIPSSLRRLAKLERLFLGKNSLQGNIPTEIGNIPRLGLMSLYQNQLSGSIPPSLHHLQQLRVLYLHENKLSGEIPPSLGDCRLLEVIDLSYNNLSGEIPPELAALPNLNLYFNLSNNLFQGSLPPVIGKMTMVQAIDVSSNLLVGSIPGTIGSCTSVQYLNLSHNSVHGSIPDSLRQLQSLGDLDLSWNNLSGTIPESLETLKMFHRLNLSMNKLTGEVPKGGIFRRLTNASFVGNEGLCGPWIHNMPSCPPPVSHTHISNSKNWRIIAPVAVTTFLICICFLAFLIWKYGKKKSSTNLQTTEALHLNVGLPRISQKDIMAATNGLSDANLLGVGNYGSVYKGEMSDGTLIAVKVLSLQNEDAHQSFDRECEALGRVRHRNLVGVITCCSNLDFKALIFPYMQKGSLEDWLYPDGDECELSLTERLSIAIDIAQALAYLHHQCFVQVLHCDLKPSNVLLGDDMTAHLTDFGIARIVLANSMDSMTSTSHLLKGSVGYIAPEYGLGARVSTKGDVFSYGVLLLEMFTRMRPTNAIFKDGLNLKKWAAENLPHRVREIVDRNLWRNLWREDQGSENVITEIMDVGLLCTQESPQERPNMLQIADILEKIRTNMYRDTLR